MQTTLAALAVLAVGYILAYLVFDRLRDRYGYVGGAEYVLLGVLLGPGSPGCSAPGRFRISPPIVSLAVGWLGMLLGTYFRLPTLALLPPEHLRAHSPRLSLLSFLRSWSCSASSTSSRDAAAEAWFRRSPWPGHRHA